MHKNTRKAKSCSQVHRRRRLLLLGRVALGAQRPIIVNFPVNDLSVAWSVCLSSALWKNGGSDPDDVWHRRSDGSGDKACSGV